MIQPRTIVSCGKMLGSVLYKVRNTQTCLFILHRTQNHRSVVVVGVLQILFLPLLVIFCFCVLYSNSWLPIDHITTDRCFLLPIPHLLLLLLLLLLRYKARGENNSSDENE